MNNNEISLHALINRHLNYKEHGIRPYTFAKQTDINIIKRPFETFKKWSIVEQTSYIESIFLRCSLEPIIRFVSDDHTILIDGYHRYNAILNFCNNKLVLNNKGLKKLKFLAGKTFKTLSEKEKNYFKNSEPINFIDYSYSNENKELNSIEEFEITRYLHILYNTGLKLEKEEFQKAQFSDDIITNKIREKLVTQEDNFIAILESLKQYNGKKLKTKIDNILLNCRLLIASTYSNIYNYSHTPNIQSRMDENYYPNINNIDKNQVFKDFELNVLLIYKRLISSQKWRKYKYMQTKPFVDATYWLISIIRKDKLGDPDKFDFIKYLEFFANDDSKVQIFQAYQSHYQQNIYNKYYAVAKYYEYISGHNMDKYFIENEPRKNYGIINNIEELYKNHFSYNVSKQQISTVFDEIKEFSYNIRPYYQRNECMNTSLSSKIIESILLDIAIPNILIYNNYASGKQVKEVVDGQQRLLSLIAFFGHDFYNENGIKEFSNKNNFALKDLRILYNLNEYKINTEESKIRLPLDYKNRILNYELTIVTFDDRNNKDFSAVDHFIRLNKNSSTIKDNSYRMWSLVGDIQIMEYEKNITQKYVGVILPPINQKRSANMVTLKLTSLFCNSKIKKIKQNDYSNIKVSNILKDFNKTKEVLLFKNPEQINMIRNKMFSLLSEVDVLYEKIVILLEYEQKNIRDVLEIKKYANIPLLSYYYLFILLNNISKEDIIENSKNIYNIINSFFKEIRIKKMKNDEIDELLYYHQQKILIYKYLA
ncbi:MAG: DUF262 domain-containing protein [Ruminococcus sp.]|nr:DUF262 domain-containing protein [Ruminococcus sp.]